MIDGAGHHETEDRVEQPVPWWRRHADVWVLLGVALGVRIVAVGRTAVIFNDGPIFLALAELMEAGRWNEALAHAYHPLYPMLIQLARFGSLEAEAVAVGLSVLAGCLAVLGLRAFLVQAWDRRVAFIGAFLLAVHPYAIRFSADVQSDALYLALFTSGVACVYKALRERRIGLACAAGALSGLAYLARPEGVGIVLVGTLLAGVAWLRGGWATRATLRWVAALWGGAFLLALPYVAVMRGLGAGWRFSQKKSISMLLGLDPASLEWPVLAADEAGGALLGVAVIATIVLAALIFAIRRTYAARGSAASRVRIGPRAIAIVAAALSLIALVVAPAALPTFGAAIVSTFRPEILLMLAIGIGSRVRREPQGRSLFVSLFIGLYAVVLFGLLVQYGYLSRRHVLPPLTLLFGYAATGVLACAEQVRSRWSAAGVLARLDTAALAGIVLGLVAAIGLPKAWHDHRGEELAGRRAAEWLAEQDEGPGLVAADRSKLGYYAQTGWRPLRDVNASPRPLEALWAEQVRWVIVEGDLLSQDGNPVSPLLSRPGYRLEVRHLAETRGRRAAVFEIVRVGPG
jgi:hypothetical protein